MAMCRKCFGTGRKFGNPCLPQCAMCRGTGRLVPCPHCRGTGWVVNVFTPTPHTRERCQFCEGQGLKAPASMV